MPPPMLDLAETPLVQTITPDITFRDRLAIGTVRTIGKPAISVISDARIIRALTDAPTRLMKMRAPGTALEETAEGGLIATPKNVGSEAPWLIYIHGGGFVAGSPYTHLGLASHLAKFAEMRVFLPAYPRAPEHPFPAGRDAVRDAYAAHVERHGPPAALCGDSAGGNLALLVAQHARDAGWPTPGALGLMSPVLDLSQDIAARMRDAPDEMLFPEHRLYTIRDDYLQGHDPSDPGASPLLGDLTGLPPTLIQASAAEAAAPDGLALARGLDHARVELWAGLPHVWQIFAGRAPVADAALRAMAAFLKAPR